MGKDAIVALARRRAGLALYQTAGASVKPQPTTVSATRRPLAHLWRAEDARRDACTPRLVWDGGSQLVFFVADLPVKIADLR